MPVSDLEEFMARAYAMELEAHERYTLFAEQLDTHNNAEVAPIPESQTTKTANRCRLCCLRW